PSCRGSLSRDYEPPTDKDRERYRQAPPRENNAGFNRYNGQQGNRERHPQPFSRLTIVELPESRKNQAQQKRDHSSLCVRSRFGALARNWSHRNWIGFTHWQAPNFLLRLQSVTTNRLTFAKLYPTLRAPPPTTSFATSTPVPSLFLFPLPHNRM